MAARRQPDGLEVLISPERLSARLRRLHAFLDDNIHHVTAGPYYDQTAKAACETALYCAQLQRWAPNFDEEWRVRMLCQLATRLRSVDVLQRLLWTPAYAGMFGLCHSVLERAAIPDAGWTAAIRRVFALGVSSARATTAQDQLEEAWCCSLIGARPPLISEPASQIAAAHPLFMRTNDAYALTHSVFYLTDFGGHGIPPAMRDHLLDNVTAGIVWALARGDMDLLGEFLLCAMFVHNRRLEAECAGLTALASTWDEPAKGGQEAGVKGGPDSQEVFFRSYHTNLVSGLVSAFLLANGSRSQPREAELRLSNESASKGEKPAFEKAVLIVRDQCGAKAAAIMAGRVIWLRAIASDLIIHFGMHTRDMDTVMLGLRSGSMKQRPTTTWIRASEWLTAFHGCLQDLRMYNKDGGFQLSQEIAATIEVIREAQGHQRAARAPNFDAI